MNMHLFNIFNYVIIYYIILQDGGRSDDADATVPWTRTQAGTVATEQVQIYSPIIYVQLNFNQN